MRNTIIASAIAVITLSSEAARADSFPFLYQIEITNMLVGTTDYRLAGNLYDTGGGSIISVDPFFYHTWQALQATSFMDSTGSFAGSNGQGAWDYDADIAAMTADQIAVGIFYNWKGQNNVSVLEIFDCASTGPGIFSEIICTGNGIAQDNGPFAGTAFTFSGIGVSAIPDIPVPASMWLMGSGLMSLVGFTRRYRK